MFTKQQFDGDIVRRYLPHSRLSSGTLLVDESTYETIRQKFVSVLLSMSLSLSIGFCLTGRLSVFTVVSESV